MAIQVTNRRSVAPPAAPPPQEEQEMTLFDYILGSIYSIDPGFQQQADGEADWSYLKRVADFLSPEGQMPEETWAQFDPQAQEWYNAAAEAILAKRPQDIPIPDGFYAPDDNTQQEEVQSPPVQQAARQNTAVIPPGVKGQQPTGLAKWHEEQRQAKAAAAAANGGQQPQPRGPAAPMQRGPAPQPAQRGAPPSLPLPARRAAPTINLPDQSQQYAAPQRRAVAQPVYTPPQQVAPQRRGPAPQQQQPQPMQRRAVQAPEPQPVRTRDANVTKDLRCQVIYSIRDNYPLTPAMLIEYARSQGYTQVDSSIAAEFSKVTSMLTLLQELGYLYFPDAQQ